MPKLVSNISYWERTTLLSGFDYLVIGNGLIGKQIALQLVQKYPKARIGLVDRSPISAGASTRNAGFACFGSVTELMADLQRSSEDAVFNLVEKRYKGIELLKADFGAEAIGFKPTGSWEIFIRGQEEELERVKAQLSYFNRHMAGITGNNETFHCKDTGMFDFNDLKQGIVNTLEGQLDTGKLNAVMHKQVLAKGIEPLYGLTVKGFEPHNGGYDIWTEEGYNLKTNRLIIATNAFAGALLPGLDIVPARGQVILTEPFEKVPFTGTFHSDSGYMYFRNVGNRILIGGGRNHFLEQEETTDIVTSSDIVSYLRSYLETWLIPGIPYNMDMSWSGIMAMGRTDKMPIVKICSDNLLVCARMGGMGVALGPVLAREVAALCD